MAKKQPTNSSQSSANDEVLRMAAIAAVLSMIESSGPDSAQIGRQQGSVWASDHRRLASGDVGILRGRQARSTWR